MDKRVSGILDVTRSGRGFLLQEAGDIPIPKDGLGGGLSGDVVEVALRKGRSEIDRPRHPRGGAEEELVRGRAGEYPVGHHAPSGRPAGSISTSWWSAPAGAPVGHKAIIDITDWSTPPAKGTIRTVFGPAGDHDTEMRAIVAGRGFDSDFSKDILAEAEKTV